MVTFGADPELFVARVDTKIPVPICGLVGGAKGAPKPITKISKPLGEGFGYQEDNVTLEFNVPVCSNAVTFATNVSAAMGALKQYLLKPLDLIPIPGSAMRFHEKAVRSEQAQTFGCSPDFNAYNDGEAFPQYSPSQFVDKDHHWRFAGGHMHFGYDPIGIPPYVIASFLDVWLGLRAVMMGDRQGERRKYYGQAGRFRPTSYGIEYRTLGNFWIWSPDHACNLAELGNRCINWIQHQDTACLVRAFSEIPWVDVRKAINEENASLAGSVHSYIMDEVVNSD